MNRCVYIYFFMIGFVSDVVLQYIPSYHTSLLVPFWEEHGSLMGAVYAGLTTLIGGALLLEVLNMLQITELCPAIVVAFLLGMVIDLLINKSQLFPSLNVWYDNIGTWEAAAWGGLALVFVQLFSIFLIKQTDG